MTPSGQHVMKFRLAFHNNAIAQLGHLPPRFNNTRSRYHFLRRIKTVHFSRKTDTACGNSSYAIFWAAVVFNSGNCSARYWVPWVETRFFGSYVKTRLCFVSAKRVYSSDVFRYIDKRNFRKGRFLSGTLLPPLWVVQPGPWSWSYQWVGGVYRALQYAKKEEPLS